jgi:hypothetical protein
VVLLAALAFWPILGIHEDGIGGVRLHDSPRAVRVALGRPTRIHAQPRRGPGPKLIDWIYVRKGFTVEFLKAVGPPTVYSVATTNPLYTTAEGAHVGSTEREVRRSAPYCRNDPYTHSRYCSNVNEGGAGGMFWRIRRGRAVSVTVSSPVY